MNWRAAAAVFSVVAVAVWAPVVIRELSSPLGMIYASGSIIAVGWLGLALWHRRKRHEHAEIEARFSGWKKIGQDRWRCGQCGSDSTGWAGRKAHGNPDTSPCAAMAAHRAQATDALRAALPGAGWPAMVEGEPEPEEIGA